MVLTSFGFLENLSYENDTLLNSLNDRNYFVRSNGVKYIIAPAEQRRFTQLLYNSIDLNNQVINEGIFNVVLQEEIPTGPNGIAEVVSITGGAMMNLPFQLENFDIPDGGGNNDQVSFAADGVNQTFESFIIQNAGGFVIVQASADLGSLPSLQLSFSESLSAGTYDLSSFTSILFTYTAAAAADQFFTNSAGQLIVTSNTNGNIEGTFEFTGTNSDNSATVEITGGSFSIEY